MGLGRECGSPYYLSTRGPDAIILLLCGALVVMDRAK